MRNNFFYSYELTFAAIAAAADAGASFQVETAYDFWWVKSQAFIYDANGLGVSTLQWPLLTVTLQEGSTQQPLASQAAAVANLFGTAQVPYILPRPHVIAAGSQLNATVSNDHGATTFSVRLMFSGLLVAAGHKPNARALERARGRAGQ